MDEAFVNVEEVEEGFVGVDALSHVNVELLFAFTEELAQLCQVLIIVAQKVLDYLLLCVVVERLRVLQLFSQPGQRLVGEEGKLVDVFLWDVLDIAGVIMWIDVENLTDFLPSVLSPEVGLEGDGQVLLTMLVRPRDDGLALSVVLYVLLYYFILQ